MKYSLSMNYLPDKVKTLKPYSTKQEKEVLLSPDDASINEILEIISDVKPMNEAEGLYLMLKLREMSVSDVLELMVDCPSCSAMNEFQIPIFKEENLNTEIPLGIFSCLEDFIEDTDEIPLSEYNRLLKIMDSNNKKLLPEIYKQVCRVPTCKQKIDVQINPRDSLSKSSLSNIYHEYFAFGKFLHYSNRDVDELIPFERGLLFQMLKKDIESPAS